MQAGRNEDETTDPDGNQVHEFSGEETPDSEVRHYVGLGSDNCWYMFTGKSVKSVHVNGRIFGDTEPGEKPVGAILKEKLRVGNRTWKNLGRSGSGPLSCVWSADSSMDMWAWGCQVPILSELSSNHEVLLSSSILADSIGDSDLYCFPLIYRLSLSEDVNASSLNQLSSLNLKVFCSPVINICT